MNLPKTVLYYGKNEPLPEQKALRAGPLSEHLERDVVLDRLVHLPRGHDVPRAGERPAPATAQVHDAGAGSGAGAGARG